MVEQFYSYYYTIKINVCISNNVKSSGLLLQWKKNIILYFIVWYYKMIDLYTVMGWMLLCIVMVTSVFETEMDDDYKI